MRVVHVVDADLIHLVENVAEVGFAVHADPLDGGHDAADDALFRRGVRIRQVGRGINVEAVQVRQQFLVDEVEQLAVAIGEQFLPFPTDRVCPLAVLGCLSFSRKRRGPILPAERAAPARVRSSRRRPPPFPWSRDSCASRMRRNRIQVSSGTYCSALAQFERRIMSQMLLTKLPSDCAEEIVLSFFSLTFLDMFKSQRLVRGFSAVEG